MSKLDRLNAISKLSHKNKNWIHKDIFRLLYKEEIWISAYEKLKGNKGAMTPGSEEGTMDGMSLLRLKRLREKVYAEAYNFKPVKRIYIPSGNKRRPLGLPTANDKIVQEVIRLILEAIYEPIFSELSFGFRVGLGCHDALNHVENKFRWVDYVIEGDIQQAYPSINHKILINFLNKRINDPRFIRLIWKLLGCGVLDEERVITSKTGVPQGSIVSPILANIYFHELDNYVEDIVKRYATPINERSTLRSKDYKTLEHKISKISKEMRSHQPQSKERQKLAKELKLIRKKRLQISSLKDKVTRIEYVRYADDWMIGIAGDRKLATQIKKEISLFLKNTLLQDLHPTKTKITDLRKGNAQFLGYEIFLPSNRPITEYKGKGVRTIRRGQPQLRFDIPVDSVAERLSKRGYIKLLANGRRPISKASYAVLEDHVIISHYRNLWLGLFNYYSGCTNRGRLQYFHYLLHISCAMTLGHRHRMSCSKIFAKYGKELKVQHNGKQFYFPYKNTWKLKERKWFLGRKITLSIDRYANLVSRSSLGLPCAVCDEEGPCEMHHVKHVKKQGFRYEGFTQQMSLLNRKQIPLCKNCHKMVHAGKYNGPSLSNLRKAIRKRSDSC
jgi:group II intron reverse transcriptase/maturase